MSIRVIDSMMGTGKTQAMYNEIRTHPEKSYFIVTPFLSTIEDAIKELPNTFQPEYKGGTKLDSLKYLLSHGYNIACTHSLFLNVDNEVWDMVEDGGYTLFVDEVLDIIKPINDLIDDPQYMAKVGTADFLINNHIISVDEKMRVTWCGGSSYDDYEYKYLEKLISTGNVLCVEGKLFLWMFPPQIFQAFNNIVILSYLFTGSVFDAYLQMHDLDYTLGGVTGRYGEGFVFTEYSNDSELRKSLKSLITIYDGKANDIGNKHTALSSRWYDRAGDSDLEAIRTGFNTFLKRAKKTYPDGTLMWTSFVGGKDKHKDLRAALCIDGAGAIRRLTPEESAQIKADSDYKNRELNKLRCFVSCNSKATNDYADRQILAYLVNRFHNPLLKRMMKNVYGIMLDEERFALSEMIQWIWRSRIRQTALPDEERKIVLYIPSIRMRNLLTRWLDGAQI